ncbi:hypothetical protein FACS1894164_01990 [Spirochaetia bacterium]|nr:hypothetical protein FACS1894164_01990 [Spirochaetia bacterium]
MANERRRDSPQVVLSKTTSFDGILRFKETVRIQGKFKGTIEAQGDLFVDEEAVVEADRINVHSLSVSGKVTAPVFAKDKVDLFAGSELQGDLTATRLRIADGVLFEGRCTMTTVDRAVEIFSRPTEEIKAELQRNYEQRTILD